MKHLIFIAAFLISLSSCSKQKKGYKNKNFAYYTEDFKSVDVTILNTSSKDIDALWFEFTYNKKEDNTYTLIVKSDGEFVKESGHYETNWKTVISFSPNQGDSYEGKWIDGKEKFTLNFDQESNSTKLIFSYKH